MGAEKGGEAEPVTWPSRPIKAGSHLQGCYWANQKAKAFVRPESQEKEKKTPRDLCVGTGTASCMGESSTLSHHDYSLWVWRCLCINCIGSSNTA